jgi:hypothetical protein
MISREQFSDYFDKGAKRMNREVLHYRVEEAEPALPSAAELRELDRAIARFWERRRRLKTFLKNGG